MFDSAVDHLIHNVMPSLADYSAAEDALSLAYAADTAPAMWETEARSAKRHAANLAIAIDGLTDRYRNAAGGSKKGIRASVEKFCVWPGTAFRREGCIKRVEGVANAYKHQNLRDLSLPITSDEDVLVVALGYGLDAYGVGKYGGMEVIVREKTGQQWKFLGDAPVAVTAWMQFLNTQGATLPSRPYHFGNLKLYP